MRKFFSKCFLFLFFCSSILNHTASGMMTYSVRPQTGFSFDGLGFRYKSNYHGHVPIKCWVCDSPTIHVRVWQKHVNFLFIFDFLPFGKKFYDLYCPCCGLSLPIRDEWLEDVLALLIVDKLVLDNSKLKLNPAAPNLVAS